MSSGDEDFNRGDDSNAKGAAKRGRVGRACDTCRRKKIRCDFQNPHGPEGKCSNCAAYNYECTYVEAAKKRGPPKGYVESLENRLQRMETLLQRLCPDADFTQELGVVIDRETWWNDRTHSKNSTSPSSTLPPSNVQAKSRTSSPGGTAGKSRNARPSRGGSGGTFTDGSDDESVLPPLSEEVQRLTLSSMDRRFHGKSSGLVLVQAAIDMKREYTGTEVSPKEDLWSDDYESRQSDVASFDFPPPDLMEELIPLYFHHNNLYLPLLHRPTFERQYRDGVHEREVGFACVLLLVCAVASRFSKDPRVLQQDLGAPGDQGKPPLQTAGWKYFDQVQMQRKSLTAPATLCDLQQYALAGIFLQGSEAPYASWVTVGIGLRVAQDVGAHRRRHAPASVENELWKRAFWVLVNLDRLSSAALGRPCAIHDEDFDLDPPLEVNDEYWEGPSPEECFKQPKDVATTTSFFNALIKLDQMLSFALRTIYSINKSKIILGYTDRNGWARDTVAELDTALNKWIDSVPQHLRWPIQDGRGQPVFFQQSSILYATYYYIQILVHRPFIPRPGKPAPLTYPSLAICTNAARSCSQVLEAYLTNKCDVGSAPFLMYYAFTSGLVLLLNIWGMRRQGDAEGPERQMFDVHRCMRFLKVAQERWHLAGRLGDILCELASAGDFPLPQPSPGGVGIKRTHEESESPVPVPDFLVPSPEPPRRIRAPPKRTTPIPPQSSNHRLIPPVVYTTSHLGKLPLHPDMDMMSHQGYDPSGQMVIDPNGWFDANQGLTVPGNAGPVNFDGSPHGTVSHMFNPHTQQPYPHSAPPYGPGFQPDQQGMNGFLDPNSAAMQGQQQQENLPWPPTLDMWSVAPTGFVSDDWNHFITNVLPDRQGPSS
ncbi:hypothetical protein M422DRAFT_244680 [Sphaerobolus stellatus SS14]|nr:hypothetical protein M422DRAFT_244680 [Sphaerobolus stellatus SS14]